MRSTKRKSRLKQINKKSLLTLVGILLLAGWFRFYRLLAFFPWSMDEEYWAYLPYNIATGYHFPLIGGHISGTGLYSGPLFVWAMGLLFFFGKGNPLFVAVLVSLAGVLSTWLVYSLGKIMFEQNIGLLAALFYAGSFLMSLYDRKYWNASFIPLFSLITVFCIFKIYQGKLKWSYLLAVTLAFAFHSHMTSGILLLLTLSAWWLLKLPVNKREIKTALWLFLLLQLPLLWFEFRHNFLNSRALLDFSLSAAGKNNFPFAVTQVTSLFLNSLSRLFYLPPGLDIAKEISLCPEYADLKFLPRLPIVLIPVAVLVFLVIGKQTKAKQLLLLTLALNYFALLWYRQTAKPGNFYSGQASEYFFFPAFPLVFILAALFLVEISRKLKTSGYLNILIISLFLTSNFWSLIKATNSDGYEKKLSVVKQAVLSVNTQPFSLDVATSDPCKLYGYRYLFTYLRQEPSQSYLDAEFSWLYEKRIPRSKAVLQVLIQPDKEKPAYSLNYLNYH